MNSLLIYIGAFLISNITLFLFGYFKGKSAERNKYIKDTFNDLSDIKKRENERRNDDIETIKNRMAKYVRD